MRAPPPQACRLSYSWRAVGVVPRPLRVHLSEHRKLQGMEYKHLKHFNEFTSWSEELEAVQEKIPARPETQELSLELSLGFEPLVSILGGVAC